VSEQSVIEFDVLKAGKVGRRKDLSEFYKDRIAMTRRVDQNISEMAAMFPFVVVRTYQGSDSW